MLKIVGPVFLSFSLYIVSVTTLKSKQYLTLKQLR